MKLKYRIFNKWTREYEPDLYLSQDTSRLMREGWTISLSSLKDYQVEWGFKTKYGTFYENDIVEWKGGEYGELFLSECELQWNGYSILEFDESAKVVGNSNFDDIDSFIGPDENYLYESKAGK